MTLVRFAPTTVARRRNLLSTNQILKNTPLVNIIETDDSFQIQLAVPGISKEQIKLDVKEDQLFIESLSSEQEDEATPKFIRKEYDFHSFKKVFNLTDEINQSSIDATLENGILTVTLEKKEEAKAIPPRTITIK